MMPGSVIGQKYRLTRQIGEGAMGVVWAAVHGITLGEVALKLILRSNEDLRRRLIQEARASGKLRHRNIVQVHDVGTTDSGDPFLVMPLLTGETLAELLGRQRRLDQGMAAQIARDVCRALAAAHAAGIIHRDLKPANIFLHQEAGDEGPVVKVLDFGVSKDLELQDSVSTAPGGVVGSPAYMSPEQARREPGLDARTDIWSLGVVLFEMLTGVRPFQGDENQIIAKIAVGEIPRVSRFVRHVDPGLVELVARCLERDRARRVASAAELAVQLQRHVSADTPPASDFPPAFPQAPPAPLKARCYSSAPPPALPELDVSDAVTMRMAPRKTETLPPRARSPRFQKTEPMLPPVVRVVAPPSPCFTPPPSAPRFGPPPDSLPPASAAAQWKGPLPALPRESGARGRAPVKARRRLIAGLALAAIGGLAAAILGISLYRGISGPAPDALQHRFIHQRLTIMP